MFTIGTHLSSHTQPFPKPAILNTFSFDIEISMKRNLTWINSIKDSARTQVTNWAAILKRTAIFKSPRVRAHLLEVSKQFREDPLHTCLHELARHVLYSDWCLATSHTQCALCWYFSVYREVQGSQLYCQRNGDAVVIHLYRMSYLNGYNYYFADYWDKDGGHNLGSQWFFPWEWKQPGPATPLLKGRHLTNPRDRNRK